MSSLELTSPVDRHAALKRWAIRAVKLGILILLGWFISATFLRAWAESLKYRWELHPGWLVPAGAFYAVSLLSSTTFWHIVLRTLGQQVTPWQTLRAYCIGNLGKYVPGKAMVVILRAGLIRGPGIDTGVAAASVFVETLTMIAVGSFWAATYLAIQFRQESPMFSLGAVGLMVVAGLPTLPPVFRFLARKAGVGRSDPAVLEKLGQLRYRTLLIGWGLMFLTWLLMGLSYWATLRAMGLDQLSLIDELPRYSAAVAMATVAGFMAVLIPAGLGVRESFLAHLMTPYLMQLSVEGPKLAALVSAALLRLIWLVTELCISGVVYGLTWCKAPRECVEEAVGNPR